MLRHTRQNKKTIFIFFLFLQFLMAGIFPAQAGLFGGSAKIPSSSSMASDLERRYNLDLGSLQEQGQVFNVGRNKVLTPEVSLFFTPSDPREGEKISAKAFPTFFSNVENALYYTWYLKRAGCDLTNSPSSSAQALCDRDGDGNITVEDWKIESARILAQNGYDNSATSYGSGSDDDGYKARYGGDNKTNTPSYCYVNDPVSGTNYELATGSDTSFSCPSGTSPVCMVGEGNVTSGVNNTTTGGNSYFEFSDTDTCSISGTPTISSSGTVVCNVGSPRCVADPTTTNSCGTALTSGSTSSSSSANPYCRQLFPKAPGATTGDGSFGTSEEQFWGTDPNDPDTADNGNKDEANVAGLGQSTFTWNYVAGDQIGVVVEGTSMLPTKHDDSSYMVMWAFSKKDCPISLADATGSYTTTIKGYRVTIPTADFDLNKCLERNLVDPTQGGQATNLEVAVSATPDSPVNDETVDKAGDTVSVQASVSNGRRPLTDMAFDWKVEISDNIQFSASAGDTADITADLRSLGLLGNTKGNALDTLRLKLDIQGGSFLGGKPLSAYLIGGKGYLRFTTRVTENFASGITRKGRSDVIVKFTSSGRKISAYKASPVLSGSQMKVSLPGSSGLICNLDSLDRTACRIIKNEIIGLRVDPSGLSNFNWTINGVPLLCSNSKVSGDCTDGAQNEVNFFPVTGNVGDTYTVVMTANDAGSGNILTLSRTFHVVQPSVTIQSLDQNTAWPKFLGQYKDLTGQATTACPGGWCSDYSSSIFEAFEGGTLSFRAAFVPSFLGNNAQREWSLDGEPMAESAPSEISFVALKVAPLIYNVSLVAQVAQSDDTRRALLAIWNISPFDSIENNFSVTNQIEMQAPGLAGGNTQADRQYLAALSSYLPASVLFTFRILLFAVLVLFSTHFLFALLQDRRLKAWVASFPQRHP